MAQAKADIGLIGLAVMGENLALNIANHGFTIAVFNRTVSKVDNFVNGRAKGKSVIGTHSVEDLAKALKKPRRIMMMVQAGGPVDALIQSLVPHLEQGDILIDGGNSYYPDTTRRARELEAKGILFVGSGVSGGEEGALNGPSLMPGGNPKAWPHIKDIFQSIAAHVDPGNAPCCDWVGEEGAGHFVKMVHNGIEYGDMQLISEAYQLLKEVAGLSNEEMAAVFEEWNKGDLDSYLIELTSHVLKKKDEETGKYVVDIILDAAGQKGTGKWTVNTALDFGQPVTLIAEAVFARILSSLKDERVAAAKVLPAPGTKFTGDKKAFIKAVGEAIYSAKIVSYAQGYTLIRAAGREYKWHMNMGGIALMWRGGCIIRSRFLGEIEQAFKRTPDLSNLLLDDFFRGKIGANQGGWRHVASVAVQQGIPIPAMSAALAYYDGYRTERLPANILQAQRDYFGAHQYERVDKKRGEFFHTNWTGHGGTTASTAYNV